MTESALLISDFVPLLTPNIEIQVIVFDVLSDIDKQYIRENLVEIARGANSTYPLKTIAKKLKKLLDTQSEKNRHGLTAEFFQAVIFRNFGFNQEYAYKNLEENSAKKGFDGLFTDSDGEIWLLESKSAYVERSHKNKHKGTIDRSYKGIKSMISGATSNDPWENALSHSQAVKSDELLIKQLEQLSINYTDDKFTQIDASNIIVGSAVFHENIDEIENDPLFIAKYVNKHQAKNEKISVLTFSKPELFSNFLEELANE